MKIAMMGSGGVGGYLGARLAKAGHDVRFVARGAHLEAMEATDDPRAIGPVDLVVFAVKLWGSHEAARQVEPLLGQETAVITFQNGVEANGVVGGVVGLSALTAMTRRSIGPIRQDPDTRAFLLDVMREVVAVGRTRGVRIDPGYAEERLGKAAGVPTPANRAAYVALKLHAEGAGR